MISKYKTQYMTIDMHIVGRWSANDLLVSGCGVFCSCSQTCLNLSVNVMSMVNLFSSAQPQKVNANHKLCGHFSVRVYFSMISEQKLGYF